MAREIGQRVKGLENEQGLLWEEVRALRDRITRGWGATLKVILRPPGNVSIADGRHVAPETSGQADLGTASLPFGTVYANAFTNPGGEVVATEITDQDGGANIKAARSATASMLLALDGSAKFPASTITTSANFTWTGDHTFVGYVLSQSEGVAGFLSYRYTDDTSGPYWSSRKARGSIASPAIVSDNDVLWNLYLRGHDGTAWINAARIQVRIDGTPGVNDMPGEIVFGTTPDGSDTLQDRVRIRSTGVTEFYDGLALSGATGVNAITVPDNVAQAVHLVDAGGIEYMRVVSVDAQPIVVFNEGGADIDHRWEASGQANALFLQGSTGNVSLGTDTPSADAILELSSTTKALLLTRMTTTQRDALTAVNGMVLYNSTTSEINLREGGSWLVPVPTARQVIAGSGLTGGGALSSNVTLNVGAGDGIDAAADAIAVDVTDFIDTAYGLTESTNNIRINAGTGLGFSSGALVHASGDLGDLHTNYLLASGTRAMAGNLNMGGHSITSVANVDGVDVSAHGSRHERAGADEIDGDHLDIDWNPTNYTPSTSPAEASSVDHLTAHLAGIDAKLVGSELKQYVFTFDGMMSAGGTSWSDTAGDFYYDTSKYPTGNATWRATLRIRTTGPTAYIRLYDVTSSTTVATLSTTQTSYQHLSTSVSLTNGHYYRIQIREGTGGNYADALGTYLEW